MAGESMNVGNLRERAERLRRKAPAEAMKSEPADLMKLIHELQLHQTELEIQNEEMRRVQLELQASRDRFADLYDFAPIGYLTVASSGRIIAANLVAANLFQVTRRKLIGSWLSQYATREGADKLYQHFRDAAGAKNRLSCELGLDIEGKEVHVRLETVSLAVRGTTEQKLRIAITDITRQKLAEQQRSALEQQLLEAERLKTLGRIASGAAHDFKNLLSPILAYAELADFTVDRDSPTREYLKGIKQATLMAAELCEKMQGYAAHEIATSAVDLDQLVDALLPLLVAHVPANTELVVQQDKDTPKMIAADKTQIDRALMNLVINAVEAIGKNRGRIKISTRVVNLDERELSKLTLCESPSPGPYVRISVTDNGSGMDRLTLRRILDPFFSTKFPGRGLGMSAIAETVQEHQAGISIDSQLNQGTTIAMYFPQAATPQPAAMLQSSTTPQPADNDEHARGVGTVLLVDDESSILSSTRLQLESAGYSVIPADSGHEAVRLFGEMYNHVDVVLIDFLMPELNGLETIKRLKQIDPQVKAILHSGCAEKPDLGDVTISGYIEKPALIDEFTKEIMQAMQ